ncbi:uncharacterized protein LOC124253611 [Haliotis rubra]|uniref:uncharacterized protein LOC124253611 n=1 Tax=Haliotis rubra TaxID=36100 RepID=UPI001EE5C508|nr:uncharacterized protein LOC124253611 [Haliotis rubra]
MAPDRSGLRVRRIDQTTSHTKYTAASLGGLYPGCHKHVPLRAFILWHGSNQTVCVICPSIKCEREVSVVEGKSLDLECDVEAYPDPHTLTWSHSTGYKKEVSSMTEKYHIPKVSHSDGGLYTCEAQNNITDRDGNVDIGVGTCTIRVTVHDVEATTLPVVAANSHKGGNSMTTVVYVVGTILVLSALVLVIVLVVLTLKRLQMKGKGKEDMKMPPPVPENLQEEHAYEGLTIR